MYGTPTERALDSRVSELEQVAEVMIETIEALVDTVELLIEKVATK